MPDNIKSVKIRALKIRQPIGDFFVGVVSSVDLLSICYADVRRIEKERDFEKYLGIQRPLNPSRVAELKDYVKMADATFPSAVILAVEGRSAEWNEAKGVLTLSGTLEEKPDETNLPTVDKIAKILDGQHRVAGLEDYSKDDFELNVSIFVDADIAEQANIFATVNLAQTKVNKSLVYDLFELARARSPQKTCHNVAVALDSAQKSPFFERIKRLGVATEGRFNETITQATVVEALLRYISREPNKDRDILLRGKRLPKASPEELQKRPFRNLFIEEQDDDIAKIVWSYFSAVSSRWPTAWNNFDRGNILIKTNGFKAFMRALRPIYLQLVNSVGELITSSEVRKLLNKVDLRDEDFNTNNFPPGSSGEASLYRKLVDDIGLR